LSRKQQIENSESYFVKSTVKAIQGALIS